MELHTRFLQGSAATDLRGGNKLNLSFLHSSFLNSTVNELLKFAYFCQIYH